MKAAFILIVLIVSTALIQGCSKEGSLFITRTEMQALDVDVLFSPFDYMTGVDESDAFEPLIPNELTGSEVNFVEKIKFIKRCDVNDYELEKEAALSEAMADPDRLTIPVKYSISFGTPYDRIAHNAYERSILRADDDGVTQVSVGPINKMNYNSKKHKLVMHYVADHTEAREQYIQGQKCFFSTIQVLQHEAFDSAGEDEFQITGDKKIVYDRDGIIHDEVRKNGRADHKWRVMHYGSKYSKDRADLSPRLFKRLTKFSQEESIQIIPLYVADIREQIMEVGDDDNPIINRKVASSSKRGYEYRSDLGDIFHLHNLFINKRKVIEKLSTDKKLVLPNKDSKMITYKFTHYEGVSQLIDNILFAGMSGLVMSTQYTPIVLDLGKPNIKTSSMKWGTFFNLKNQKGILLDEDGNETKSIMGVPHMTAWVGGDLQMEIEPPLSQGVMVQRDAEDGFLVIPNKKGVIKDSSSLFGTEIIIDGKKFDNGFLALKALAKKDCSSDDHSHRYLGPWDRDLYYEILKVWVDKNRNGVSEKGEISSLKESGVAAINVCYILHKQESDMHGNETEMRSPFLYFPTIKDKDFEITAEAELEIALQLMEGVTSNGDEPMFRVAIDVKFSAAPENYFMKDIKIIE